MQQIVSSLNRAFTLAFVITSMFGLGLGSTVRGLVAPLRNIRLVVAAVAINVLFLPGFAWILTHLLPLHRDLEIGLIVMSAVAGAPLAIKATQLARGDEAAAGSVVVLLVLVTVFYLPFALSFIIPGLAVDPVAVATPLVLEIVLPLAAGLIMNVRYDEEAQMTRRVMTEISNVSLAVMLVLNLGNVPEVVGLIGTGALASAIAIILAGFAAGYLLGGPDRGTRKAVAFGSAQRNYAAGFVLAQGSFAGQPDVFLMLLTASLLSMVLILVAAGELGRRARELARRA